MLAPDAFDPNYISDNSPSVKNSTIAIGPFEINYSDGLLHVFCRGQARIIGAPWFDDGMCGFRMDMPPDAHYYGFGEKNLGLDKRGTRMTMWNMDIYADGVNRQVNPHSAYADPLYSSINFFIQHNPAGGTQGIFVHTPRKTHFDLGMDNNRTLGICVEDDTLDLFIIDGPRFENVISRYTLLTGRMKLPPLWTLGYHQCRWSYGTEPEVRDIARKLREHKIPCDAVWIDIEYMDKYKTFTVDPSGFPDMKALTDDLRRDGFKVVTNIDPGFADDENWNIRNEGIENNYFVMKDNEPYRGKAWPGDSLFPDFRDPEVRNWFGELVCAFASENGIDGIWFDMNEPADGKDQWSNPVHLAFGNLFGHMELIAASDAWDKHHPGQRKFFLTRSGCAGTQRYAALWTGDNMSRWEHLEMSVPMLCNLGLSGMPFVGADIGGFGLHCDGELLARWTQCGAFTPFFRNHTSINTTAQEPWAFSGEVLDICRDYIELRYRLLPYIYSAFHHAVETGAPIMRPMIYEFPGDARFASESKQYMFGDHFLVAPVSFQGVARKRIRLPEGNWVDFHTGEIHAGNSELWERPSLGRLPLFVRGGAPVPLWRLCDSVDRHDPGFLRIECYPGGEAGTLLYEDDGDSLDYEQGDYAKILLRTTENEVSRILVREPTEGDFRVQNREIEVAFIGCEQPPSEVLLHVDGQTKNLPFREGESRSEISVIFPDSHDGFTVELR